jgi:Ran GTPase-activating protein (RanGAP) involved in mRNA processing and transport
MNDQMLHNFSVTNLNIGGNNFAWESMEALVKVIKNNAVISRLCIDVIGAEVTPQLMDPVFSAIKLYNPHIDNFCVNENPISVKNLENIAKMVESKTTFIRQLELSNCNLKYQHLEKVPKYLVQVVHLCHLNLSNNKLTDKAAKSVAEVLKGTFFEGMLCPPLKHVDLTNCGFTAVGGTTLLTALAHREAFEFLDLSNNPIGSDCAAFCEALATTPLSELHLNMCSLGTKGSVAVFNMLGDASAKVGLSLQSLYLSGNDINDSAGEALCNMLQNNVFLEILDLGFNQFTDHHSVLFRKTITVTSVTEATKKAFELHINMLGNDCDPYIFETPGMARAKSTFKFGIKSNYKDPLNGGFSHITASCRGQFMVRKAVNQIHKDIASANAQNIIA